jgi:hypothetical protein
MRRTIDELLEASPPTFGALRHRLAVTRAIVERSRRILERDDRKARPRQSRP